MKCKICDVESVPIFKRKILGKYYVQYFHCRECNFVFTEEPFWLQEAYKRPVNITDTGIMSRNQTYANFISVLIYFFYEKEAAFLDYAGGYGIFTRLMRDIGFDFYWSDNFCENILAQGFEYDSGRNTDIKLITALEVFEHFVNPSEEIRKMLNISRNIAFTTEVFSSQIPEPGAWDYYAFHHGQHISFYSPNALRTIAKKFGLNYLNFGNFHLFTIRKINPVLFKLLMFLSKRGLFEFVKKATDSKTFDDYRELKFQEINKS